MERETLKAWVHFALLNPVDEHQLAHAKATKSLLEEVEALQDKLASITSLYHQLIHEWDETCEESCNSYGHAELCKNVDLGEAKRKLKAENARFRDALEDIVHCIYSNEATLDYCEKKAREALKGSND